jgi:hypothetical protein
MPLLALALATAAALGHATSDFPAPVYTIDLDLPPEQRWHEAVTGQITKHGWEYSFKPVLDYIDTVVPPTLWSEHEMALRKIAEPIIGDEATAELRGIQSAAVALGHNISLAELEFFQVFCASSTHAPAAPPFAPKNLYLTRIAASDHQQTRSSWNARACSRTAKLMV